MRTSTWLLCYRVCVPVRIASSARADQIICVDWLRCDNQDAMCADKCVVSKKGGFQLEQVTHMTTERRSTRARLHATLESKRMVRLCFDEQYDTKLKSQRFGFS